MANPNPDWRAAAGGPPRKKAHGWQQEEPTATGNWRRSAKLAGLSAAGLTAFAGIVWLIYLLWPTDRPGLLAVAADPAAACDRLDVPYDPYGWLSGRRLLKWAGSAEGDAPKPLRDAPVWLDDVDEWANQIGNARKVDPVLIYVGLPGGVNRAGDPVLYAGRADVNKDVRDPDAAAVRLATLLDKLDEHAKGKRKVLVLDVARGLPDPVRGEVYPDFVRAVREKLADRIAGTPNLVVICGADDGQRAWEAPGWGMTALAHHLAAGLGGDACPPSMSSFTASDLYEYLRRAVEDWSKNKRAAVQQPVVFPPDPGAWGDDRRQAFDRKKFFLPKSPDQARQALNTVHQAGPADVPARLADRWAKCGELAGRQPPPAAYTPAAWRRYRELLLRFEQAVLAGDADGAAKLEAAAKAAEDAIGKGLDVARESAGYAVPLAAAAGRPEARPAAAGDLDRAAGEPTLTAAADRLRRAGGRPPVEAHLPLMLRHFVTDVLKVSDDPLAATWKPAVETRMLAERSAYGVRPGEAAHPYSERAWPLVRGTIQKADEARRRGEDLMLAAGRQAEAEGAFTEAKALYDEAGKVAERVQLPLRVRDESLADLPFLARWLSEAEVEDNEFKVEPTFAEALRAWGEAHRLAALLERLPDGPAAAADLDQLDNTARQVRDGLARLIDACRRQAQVHTAAADTQKKLQAIQHLLLLPPPLLPPADREQLVRRATAILRTLDETDTKLGDAAAANPGAKAVRRAMAAAQSLGGEWGKLADADRLLSRPDPAALSAANYPLAETARFAFVVAEHRRKLAAFEAYPSGDRASWRAAEAASRQAVPFAAPPDPEPATTNAWAAWKALLEGQAARVALDHWYDEKGQPYFTKTIARAMLDDAKALGERLGDRGKAGTGDRATAERLIAAGPLRLDGEKTDGPIRWTSEQERAFRYALGPPDYPVPGQAVVWWQSARPEVLAVGDPARQPVDVTKPAEKTVKVTAGPQIDVDPTQTRSVKVSALGYFRGQQPATGFESVATVAVNRRPGLVVADVRPPQEGGVLAVRAGKDFDPGAVAILLDYSGSMEEKLAGGTATKKVVMLDTLRDLLRTLPRGTRLTIRAFYANNSLDAANSERVFPNPRFPSDDVTACLDQVMAALERIKPDGATPLVPTMAAALAGDIPADFPGPRTLLVLTDGSDTSKQAQVFGGRVPPVMPADKMTPAEQKQLAAAVQTEVNRFERFGVSIHVILFGVDEAEDRLAREMFAPVERFEETPGRVYSARDRAALEGELLQALRPKPRLVRAGGGAARNVPRNGLPTNRPDRADEVGRLWWRGFIDPGGYELRYYQSGQDVQFDRGDALTVLLKKDGQRVKFGREVYFRDVDPGRVGSRKDDTHPDWFLSAPVYGYDRPGNCLITATAALEWKETDPGPGGVLRQVNPRFVWWELARLAGGAARRVNLDHTLYVRNLPGVHAPCWKAVADDGPVGDVASNLRLRCWAADASPAALGNPLTVTPADLQGAGRTFSPVPGVTIRARLEPVALTPEPPRPPGSPALCLVVRAEDAGGRLLQVRVPKLRDVDREHRYYYDPDDAKDGKLFPKVVGTTAVFGPVTEDELARLTDVQIEVVDVSGLLDGAERGPRTKPLAIDLGRPTASPAPLLPIEPIPPTR